MIGKKGRKEQGEGNLRGSKEKTQGKGATEEELRNRKQSMALYLMQKEIENKMEWNTRYKTKLHDKEGERKGSN